VPNVKRLPAPRRLGWLVGVVAVLVFCGPLVRAEGEIAPPGETEEKVEPEARQSEEPKTRQEILLKQREEKSRNLEPYRVSPLEARVLGWEKMRFPQNIFVKGFRGFRPVVGGMPSGSGFVGGAGYILGVDSETLQLTANARVSTKGYTAFDVEAQFPTRRSRRALLANLEAGYRDLTALDFYGLGPDSNKDGRTTFELEDRSFGGGLTYRPNRTFEVGGAARFLDNRVGGGSARRSLETLYDPGTVPGFLGAPDFFVYQAHLLLDLHDRDIRPVGLSFRFETQRWDEQDGQPFEFTRFIGEVQAHVPLPYRNRMLAVRFRTSASSPGRGQDVPFFLMETIGGAKTLRGFNEYRFRDRRNLLLNVEYRWEVWSYLDFTFFGDAGKVFAEASEFNLSGLDYGYGFGIRLHTPGGTTFRIDLARSNEGLKLHLSGGPRF
jgi:hypothetical protein